MTPGTTSFGWGPCDEEAATPVWSRLTGATSKGPLLPSRLWMVDDEKQPLGERHAEDRQKGMVGIAPGLPS